MAEMPHEFTETALAFELVAKYGALFRYVVDVGQPLFWNGSIWEVDPEATKIEELVTPLCCAAAEAAIEAGKPGYVRSLEKDSTARAVIRKACHDPRIVVTSNQLDKDPLLLGTPNGTYDYRTGRLRAPNPNDLITMSTSVAPLDIGEDDLDEEIKGWLSFLDTVYPLVPGRPEPNADKIKFLQRWWGYSTTGMMLWHHYAFFVGRGRNGKGVTFRTWRSILGDYAAQIPSEMLMERTFEPHRAEFASLRGKRLLLSNEIAEGKAWNQSRIEQFSGGDEPIRANLMRGNPFEYVSQMKLSISATNYPHFTSIDIHSTERLMVISHQIHFVADRTDFLKRFPENDPNTIVQQNPELEDELKAEHPGILAWGLYGAQHALDKELNGKQHYKGLQIPNCIHDESNSYLDAEDKLGHFVSTYCDRVQPPTGELVRKLRAVYNYVQREEGEKELSQHELRKKLQTRYTVKHDRYGSTCQGLVLNDIGNTILAKIKDEAAAAKAAQQQTDKQP